MGSENVRYFSLDDGYDKKVYENDWKNIIVIGLVFILFYGINICYFWGLVSLAMSFSEASMWYNVAIFVATIIHFIVYLIFGHKSNVRRRYLNFLKYKIGEKEQEIRDTESKEKEEEKNRIR